MTMNERMRDKVVWGWPRLTLGLVQIISAGGDTYALLTSGMHWTTYALVSVATVATITSRLLYHGKTARQVDWT